MKKINLDLLLKTFENDFEQIFGLFYDNGLYTVKEDGCVVDEDGNYYGNTNEHKKEMIRNTFGVVLFYVVLIIGVFLIDARMNQIDNQKSAIEPLTQIAQKQNR